MYWAENVVIFTLGFILGILVSAGIWCELLAPLYVRLVLGDERERRREGGMYSRED